MSSAVFVCAHMCVCVCHPSTLMELCVSAVQAHGGMGVFRKRLETRTYTSRDGEGNGDKGKKEKGNGDKNNQNMLDARTNILNMLLLHV